MNLAAIAHEATQRWCHCLEKDRFVIRIQTAKDDIQSIRLHTRDKYIPLKFFDSRKTYMMEKVACDGLRDYYEAELTFHMVCLRYCFEITGVDGTRVILANDGFVEEIPEDKERLFDCPQNLREEELFRVPEWAKNAVIYQIFPARFASDKAVSPRLWYQAPIGGGTDLGGNLRGIINALDYIQELGADVVYMTPIFRSPSVHKYNTTDYYTIDPGFGTEDDLRELVEKAHGLGMKVILDAVFNHTGTEFFAFQDLKKNGEKSRYKDWYYVEKFPVSGFPKPSYKCFGYFGNMPKVNLRNPEAGQYFTDVALYWLRKAGIDGWRLDVGDEVSHEFWREFRKTIKKEFPEALIVGEIWHHAPDFLQGDQWDSVMNYPFHRAVEDFAGSGTISASTCLGRLGYLRGNTHRSAYSLLWNLIGSHDASRILHRCGENRNRHRLAAAMQLLWPGSPMIYYGDEVGMTGGDDPDCRRGMLWDKTRQDSQTLAFYKKLLALRREEPALLWGKVTFTRTEDASGLILVTRELENRSLTLVFHGKEGTVSLPEFEGYTDLISGAIFDGTLEGIGALVLAE